jgi:hypothetical protein
MGKITWSAEEAADVLETYDTTGDRHAIAAKYGRSPNAVSALVWRLKNPDKYKHNISLQERNRRSKEVEVKPQEETLISIAQRKLAIKGMRLRFNTFTKSYFLDGAPVKVQDIIREAGIHYRGMQ